MNRENLQRMADYIRTIPQEKFDMSVFRDGNDAFSSECKTVGCAVGHCTILDDRPLPITLNGEINYLNWSMEFTGLDTGPGCGNPEWQWCFSPYWVITDNTPEGAARRIEWLLANGLPDNSSEQEYGEEPLCYM
jgi:hypothetical protein